MQLSLQGFSSLMQSMAAAVQGACTQLVDLTVGSALRAVLEANASVALWVQWLIVQLLATTRAATSVGADLDSWMADYTVTRLPAAAATGVVTFSRFTSGLPALVPVGALVRTIDGSQSFAVVASSSVVSFDASQGGYVIGSNAFSVDAPVTAVVAGAGGNVQAGAAGMLATAIPGVDTVTNAAAFQGGLDAESDDALRARFQNFINTRSRATPAAIGYAVQSLQQGLTYSLQENSDTAGAVRMGSFVLTVDDGSGAPSDSLLGMVTQAVDAVRPVGSICAVQGPTVVVANVSLSVSVVADAVASQVIGLVSAAVTAFINGLPIGGVLPWSRLAQVAYAASSSVTNVSSVLLNGGTADLVPGPAAVVKAGTVAVG
jgi:uncharacterized phage protein gp47/JayE